MIFVSTVQSPDTLALYLHQIGNVLGKAVSEFEHPLLANPLKVRIMKLTLATNLPMSFPWVSKRYSSNTTGQTRLATITMKWVLEEFQDVHKGLGQLGRPVTFDMEREASPQCHSPPACSMPKLRNRKAKWKAKGRHADSVSLQLGVVT